MISNRFEEKHWLTVATRYVTDVALFQASFIIAIVIRFYQSPWHDYYTSYFSGILLGAISFSSLIYISGLYSSHHQKNSQLKRAILLFFLHLIATTLMTLLFYLTSLTLLGRGVFIIGVFISYFLVWIHHYLLYKYNKKTDRAAIIISCADGEIDLRNLLINDQHTIEIIGIILHNNYDPLMDFPVLGQTQNLIEITEENNLDKIITTSRNVSDNSLYKDFCKLRYMGKSVVSEISIYEEFYHFCPLTQITPEWLLEASASPHMFYIKKIKRAFDIFISITGLLLFSPFITLACLLIKLTSKGPVLYTQTRLGRFGKRFKVLKLRTMRTDAEKNGPEWSRKEDSRVTFFGKYFRKYRIDELPQLINILKGEMSFVGPRPERPAFYELLNERIPFFQERLLIQPGLTGWAQVNYPYGSNEQDAIRKLEYDLYYLKHLSLFLDIFIILDTFRIIFKGGEINPVELLMEQEEDQPEINQYSLPI